VLDVVHCFEEENAYQRSEEKRAGDIPPYHAMAAINAA
jgi:hypothetical protein